MSDTNDRSTLLDYVERVQDAVRPLVETERAAFFSAVEAIEDEAARWTIIQAASDWQHESVYAVVETLLDMLRNEPAADGQPPEEPPVVIGWLKFDRSGELGSDAACPECGQPLTEVWAGLLSSGTWVGPRCRWCATSE